MDALPRILYHGTTAHLAAAIKAHGLQPRDGQGPFLTGDPKRARGYAVRASCLALVDADPDADLASLPPALLVVVTTPSTALLRDPAHAGDYWLTDPNAATVRLETFDARPWIASPSDARTYARYMLKARAMEDRHGAARQRAAEGRPLADEPQPASRRTLLDQARPPDIRPPDLGKPLADQSGRSKGGHPLRRRNGIATRSPSSLDPQINALGGRS
ncbi:MAG: hypothetical protein ABW196_08730 [Solirubrobacterales bacterium]